MKTNKEDIRLLKSKHRLELVMQETGEAFEVDAEHPDHWHSKTTPGLTVDIRRQLYEIKKPGLDAEPGDLFAWLQFRFTWKFVEAIRFLKNRQPDPIHEAQPVMAKQLQPQQSETHIIRYDEDEVKHLDRWQEDALKICGERIRSYFSWSWLDLVMYVPETRIEPTHAPEVTVCPQCNSQINWHFKKTQIETTNHSYGNTNTSWRPEHIGAIPVIAYSIKRRISLSGLGLEGSDELREVYSEAGLSKTLQEKITRAFVHSFDGLIETAGALFVEEEDGVVCAKCAWSEYDFQIALDLCKTSAHRREKAAFEEQKKRDREAWAEAEREREREEQRMLIEDDYP